MMNNPYESFYQGLVASKIWLCVELEKILDFNNFSKPSVKILGGWHNLLSFMMIVRKPKLYKKFDSYDKDPDSKPIADSINDTWVRVDDPRVYNHIMDVNDLDFSSEDRNTIYINCSVDQFSSTEWFDSIPRNSIVVLQSTDIVDDSPDWEIVQKTPNLHELKARYPLSKLLYQGKKYIPYKETSYNRLMIIGFK